VQNVPVWFRASHVWQGHVDVRVLRRDLRPLAEPQRPPSVVQEEAEEDCHSRRPELADP